MREVGLRSAKPCELARANKNPQQHRAVKPAGVCIAKRRMIAADKRDAIRQLVLGSMGEEKSRSTLNNASAQKMSEVAIPGDFAEADDHLYARKECHFFGEVGRAIADLFGSRLVTGRRAPNYGADPHAAKPKAVVDVCGVRLVRESGVVEDRIEKIPGAIAGEDPPGAIAAVGSRSEAKGQDTGFRIAKARNGTRPVGLVNVRAALALANPLAIFPKSRAAFTSGNLFMEHCQSCEGLHNSYRV